MEASTGPLGCRSWLPWKRAFQLRLFLFAGSQAEAIRRLRAPHFSWCLSRAGTNPIHGIAAHVEQQTFSVFSQDDGWCISLTGHQSEPCASSQPTQATHHRSEGLIWGVVPRSPSLGHWPTVGPFAFSCFQAAFREHEEM